ncbi:MAG: 5-formyltetrahydrofolate cyclo-ligase [Deltaproteobacteria bacterium]|nr:5-formyltetrahydrofolate cyclo-ligase [Deltaproteobacteria bacterium]
MSTSNPQSEKRRLRLEMRARLAAETPQSALDAGRAVSARIADLVAWRKAARVGLFMSRIDEIDTAPLAGRIRDAGKGLLLPRMTEDRMLEFVVVDTLEMLAPGPYGILEPPRLWPATTAEEDDLLCVPGLAFDRSGGRLGRGGGYYDRTFAAAADRRRRPRLFGIGFSFQLVANVPMTERDLLLDGVITDREAVETRTGIGRRTT